MSRRTEGKMPTTTRFDLGGEGLPRMNLGGAGKRILQLAILVVLIILLMASTTSIPTGNVGVLTLFGRVTGETLPEGIHLVNPLKSVQKLSIQTQSVKESANVPSNEGLILALDTSLLFRLDKEKQEAERKRIEAQGIADFQRIVATGISAQLLEWKGIEATEKLAASSNAKVVIIGNPKNGLPLVLEPK